MGVSGCGKSSLAQALAGALGLPCIEGDDFHSPASVIKMRAGVPLDDRDRAGWLDRLSDELASHPNGAVASCSALKLAYRERLRRAVPRLYFAFLDISRDDALARVAARPDHLFPASLVDSQFATLERPDGERNVVALDASASPDALVAQVTQALEQFEHA